MVFSALIKENERGRSHKRYVKKII
ncbi:uncharacterized protein METZ01_LOCUS64664 [marine metagenome]|uniref:Uncharacterized protein n=1 Tax=marine metagenome TaxID=408172 RepID=A0A381T6J6_9ZZZZ